MTDSEEDVDHEEAFLCPYCAAPLSLMVDLTGGHDQAFTYDCEVCCRPISIRLEVGHDGEIEMSAERES